MPHGAIAQSAPNNAEPDPPRDFRTWFFDTLSDKNIHYYAGPGFSEFLDKVNIPRQSRGL
jgi:hypothetical protein